MNDYWSRPRRERWERFQKYLENEPEGNQTDPPFGLLAALLVVMIVIVMLVTLTPPREAPIPKAVEIQVPE